MAGRYEVRPGKILTLALEGGTLIVIAGKDRVELSPESETRFFEPAKENEIVFVKGADGRVTHRLINVGRKAPRRRGSRIRSGVC